MRPPRPFIVVKDNVVVFHHAYLGLLLMGWIYPVWAIGMFVFLDDVYEHVISEDSPLRLLFDKYISPRMGI